jgi:hypothetical protein
MRLARPDIFHPRIVLAGCPQKDAGDRDDAGLVGALRDRGLHAQWLSWDAPDVDRADLVILRATHDYAGRLDKFLAWTTRAANLLNPPAAVAWNADRRYLGDLAQRGVPTVPGEVFAPGDRVRLPRGGHAFVSPTIGTGGRRCDHRSAAQAYVAKLHAAGRSAFVQPAAERESVLIFLGGRPSHAFPLAEPDFEVWDVGSAALAAAAEQVGIDAARLLYARVHLVGDPGRVLELQLIDPSLGWLQLDVDARNLAQREFALAVESALERFGLGPFSHRRGQ